MNSDHDRVRYLCRSAAWLGREAGSDVLPDIGKPPGAAHSTTPAWLALSKLDGAVDALLGLRWALTALS